MADIDRDMCRKAAAECAELARAVVDPAKKEILLIRAQEWLRLAYAGSEDQFQRHLAQLNSSQMQDHGPAPAQRQPVQRKPRQSATKIARSWPTRATEESPAGAGQVWEETAPDGALP